MYPTRPRNLPAEEAGEMKRKCPSRPRVKLNPVAVWELLNQLGISQIKGLFLVLGPLNPDLMP